MDILIIEINDNYENSDNIKYAKELAIEASIRVFFVTDTLSSVSYESDEGNSFPLLLPPLSPQRVWQQIEERSKGECNIKIGFFINLK